VTIQKAREAQALKGIPFWKFSDRKAAKAAAAEIASREAEEEEARRTGAREEAQSQLDGTWQGLLANDSETVIAVIDEAFEDNQAPAAPVNVESSTLSLVMLAPTEDEIPDQKPALTPAGNLTIKKMTKAEKADGYLTLVCGHVLATIKEALAVAPSITDVKVVVVRRTDPDVYGETHFEALIAGTYQRRDLERVNWKEAEATDIIQQAADSLIWNLKGRPPKLLPLSLEDEPDLKLFIDALEEVRS
jgi:hypothetical protein